MPNRAAGEHRDVGRAAADVDEAHAEFLFVVGEHRVAGRQLLEHDVVDLEPAALHALDDVLRSALGARHDVHFRFETHAGHADGFADALLAVDHVLLRQDVQDLLVRWDCHGARRIDHAIDVLRVTSLSRIATMPCEFRLRTWLPAIPAYTEWISQPAMSSASSTAR